MIFSCMHKNSAFTSRFWNVFIFLFLSKFKELAVKILFFDEFDFINTTFPSSSYSYSIFRSSEFAE